MPMGDNIRDEEQAKVDGLRAVNRMLREQNRVLREALQLAHTALSILPLEAKQHIAGNAMATIHAALAATSQEGQG